MSKMEKEPLKNKLKYHRLFYFIKDDKCASEEDIKSAVEWMKAHIKNNVGKSNLNQLIEDAFPDLYQKEDTNEN